MYYEKLLISDFRFEDHFALQKKKKKKKRLLFSFYSILNGIPLQQHPLQVLFRFFFLFLRRTHSFLQMSFQITFFIFFQYSFLEFLTPYFFLRFLSLSLLIPRFWFSISASNNHLPL